MGNRQEEILKTIVENYIKTFKPVSSKSLVDQFEVSSATIRNDMADLEDLGLIEKEHTSSGRIPSEKGYKYYVEHLMEPVKLSSQNKNEIANVINNSDLVVSDAINRCMEIISEITHYTSVVIDDDHNATLKKISIIPIDNEYGNNDSLVVAVLVTSQGDVENKQFRVDKNIDLKELIKTSELINKMLAGTPIQLIDRRLEQDIKPIISNVIDQYEKVCGFFSSAFKDFAEDTTDVYFSGKTNLLDYQDYTDKNKVKDMINKLESDELVKHIETKDNDIKVYVGNESDFDPDTSVIKTHYKVGNEEGTLAIIGPKRMEYDKVVTLLNYLKEYLDK